MFTVRGLGLGTVSVPRKPRGSVFLKESCVRLLAEPQMLNSSIKNTTWEFWDRLHKQDSSVMEFPNTSAKLACAWSLVSSWLHVIRSVVSPYPSLVF